MPWAHNNVLDNGPAYLVAQANALHVVDGFNPASHDRSWVIANSIANASVASGDWAGPADGPVDGRRVTLPAKTATATASLGAGAGNLSVVLISSSIVLYQVDETSERAITSGESVPVPPINYTVRDPAVP